MSLFRHVCCLSPPILGHIKLRWGPIDLWQSSDVIQQKMRSWRSHSEVNFWDFSKPVVWGVLCQLLSALEHNGSLIFCQTVVWHHMRQKMETMDVTIGGQILFIGYLACRVSFINILHAWSTMPVLLSSKKSPEVIKDKKWRSPGCWRSEVDLQN